jgi:hypothetical protein
MKPLSLILSLFIFIQIATHAQVDKYYEMRTYQCHEGKRPDLIKRFENHTLELFKKHGIESIAYFVPNSENEEKLTFIIAYPSKDSRDELWNNFITDPEWITASKASEENGPIVQKVEQTFMTLAEDLNPGLLRINDGEKVFELRKYTMHPGKVEAINARFKNYTRELFQKHGIINIIYWYSVEENGKQPELIYLVSHKSEKSAKSSFNSFGKDKVWQMVRDASERDGLIVANIDSHFLKALPFSLIQ